MKKKLIYSLGTLAALSLPAVSLISCSNNNSTSTQKLVITEKDFGNLDLKDPYMPFIFNLAVGDGVSSKTQRMNANINSHGYEETVVREAALKFLNSLEWTWTTDFDKDDPRWAARNNKLKNWEITLPKIASRLVLGQKLSTKVW